MDTHSGKSSTIERIDPITGDTKDPHSSSSSPAHAAPEVTGLGDGAKGESAGEDADEVQVSKGGWFAYLKTRNFYLVLLLGYGFRNFPITPKGAVSCTKKCATQPNSSPLHNSHQHLLFAPRGTTLLHSCFPDSMELYSPYAGLWLVYNIQIWL